MDLTNDFEVDAPIEKVWKIFNDVERIAPCLPGAQLQEIAGDEYRGIVKVKVGPITAQYGGTAVFLEQDESIYRMVIRGEGRDKRGAGNASADITVELDGTETRTRVKVTTSLKVTGKVAQFGRGVMADISKKLMGQFADNLTELISSDDTPLSDSEDDIYSTPSKSEEIFEKVEEVTESEELKSSSSEPLSDSDSEPKQIVADSETEPIDLLGTAGTSFIKRIFRLFRF